MEKYMKLLYLRWQDHATKKDLGWTSIESIDDVPHSTIEAVGFLIRETDEAFYLAQGVGIDDGEKDDFRNLFIVLKKDVIKKKTIQRFK